MNNVMMQALSEIPLDLTKSEKETLSEILNKKQIELIGLQSKQMTRLEEIHAKRLTIQINKLKEKIGRL